MSAIQQALLAGKTVLTYATWNPSDVNLWVVLSGGNLVADSTGNVHQCGRATVSKSSRKWYWENTIWKNSGADMQFVGIADSTMVINPYWVYLWQNTNSYWYYGWYKYHDAVSVWPITYWTAFSDGDIISVLLDLDAWELTFWNNWVSQWVAYTWVSGTYFPAFDVLKWGSFSRVTANFWATAFTYTPPAWYNNWVYS